MSGIYQVYTIIINFLGFPDVRLGLIYTGMVVWYPHWNLATPDIDVYYVDIEDHNIDVFFDIEYSNLDIDVIMIVFDIVVTKKTSISTKRRYRCLELQYRVLKSKHFDIVLVVWVLWYQYRCYSILQVTLLRIGSSWYRRHPISKSCNVDIEDFVIDISYLISKIFDIKYIFTISKHFSSLRYRRYNFDIKGRISMSISNWQTSISYTIWTHRYWRCKFDIEGKASILKTQGPSQWRLMHSRNTCAIKGHLLCDFCFSRGPSRAAPKAFINGGLCCGVARHSPCISPRSGPAAWRPRTSRANRPHTSRCRRSR